LEKTYPRIPGLILGRLIQERSQDYATAILQLPTFEGRDAFDLFLDKSMHGFKGVPAAFARLISERDFSTAFARAQNYHRILQAADSIGNNPDVAPALVQFFSAHAQDVLRVDGRCDVLIRLHEAASARDKSVLLAAFVDDITFLFSRNRVPRMITLFRTLFRGSRIECPFQPRSCASFVKHMFSSEWPSELSGFVVEVARVFPEFANAIVRQTLNQSTDSSVPVWKERHFALELCSNATDSSLAATIGCELQSACQHSLTILQSHAVLGCLNRLTQLLTQENYEVHEQWTTLLYLLVSEIPNPPRAVQQFLGKMVQLMSPSEVQSMIGSLMATILSGDPDGFDDGMDKAGSLIEQRSDLLEYVRENFSVKKDVWDEWNPRTREKCRAWMTVE
jgi:hypothetical protein